ncbi:hypothetical protein DYB26_002771 [Aphanomyces astaci]|uniref:PCI domain-containing protein n=1 Tax=Aphanomyces astaci TaxID=112090 RepID=A0A3R6YCQ1_APHAT|nr:hypothetical protein DYB26_002771 [Aphanomyces astaci]
MADHDSTTATDLVSYVNAILKETSTDATSLSVKDAAALVVSKAATVLAVEGHNTDVEGLFKLLVKATGTTHADALVKVVTANHTNAILKLRILADLFNATPAANAALRFQVLLATIQYAGVTQNLSLCSYVDNIDALVVGVSADNLKTLYLTIADLLEKNEKDVHAALRFLEKYLTLVEAADAAKAKAVAVRAAVLVIKSPIDSFVAHVDLIHLPAVQALKGVFDLLDIFSSKTLTEYLAFEKSSTSVLKEHGIDAAAAAANMRLLTLCAYPTGHDDISFDDIIAKLQVAETDVETWVVRAITANLIQAKINQLGRSVVISRSLQRGFALSDWTHLHATLLRYIVDDRLLVLEGVDKQAWLEGMTKQRATPTRGKKHASGDDDSPPSLPTTAASSAPSSAVLAYQRAQDGEHIVTLVVDFLLHAVDATIDETLKANNTFEYTSLKLVNGLIYMMSMVTIDLSTKFKDNPATYEAGDTPAPCPPDIWSKQCIKAKKKPKSHLLRGHSHNNPYGLGSLDEDGEGSEYRSAYQGSPSSKQMLGGRRSMEKSSQQLGSIVLDTEVTMSIRDLAFRTVSPGDMPLSPDDLQRRQHIEQLLEERVRDEKIRMQADAKRSRTVVRLVIDPVDSDTKPVRKGIVDDGGGASPDMGASPVRDGVLDGLGNDRGASEVILVEGADMIVGEDSHLVSRRSKRDMFKHIPQAVFEPTALLATDEPFYIGNGDLEGGPCFGDDSSPAKGVVITQGLVVKSGQSFWEGPQQHNPNGGVHAFPRV